MSPSNYCINYAHSNAYCKGHQANQLGLKTVCCFSFLKILTNNFKPVIWVLCVSRVSMQLELLSKDHLEQLLAFELENRSWFESLIEPRDDDFYSAQGVERHIDVELEKVSSGSSFCGLLFKNNEIVARANLRDIGTNRAFVGYRVSKRFISQGYASFCLASLIEIAKREYNVQSLGAKVLENNPASKHVLLKQGFEVIGDVPSFITINNTQLACTEFRLTYA